MKNLKRVLNNFWEDWAPIIVLAIYLLCIFFGVYLIDKYSCLAKTSEIGFPSKYTLMSGCRIFVENRWIPLDNWFVNMPQ